jgi:3-hydroxyisobutyrate dehydrogenase
MDTPYLHMKSNAILEEALEAAFPLRLAVKDAGLVLEAGREAGIDLPLIEVVRRQFARAVELGHGDEDMAATYFATASENADATGAAR